MLRSKGFVPRWEANAVADHSLRLVNRNHMELTGVVNVNTFDEQEIVLETQQGFLGIAGQQLHITLLNLDVYKRQPWNTAAPVPGNWPVK